MCCLSQSPPRSPHSIHFYFPSTCVVISPSIFLSLWVPVYRLFSDTVYRFILMLYTIIKVFENDNTQGQQIWFKKKWSACELVWLNCLLTVLCDINYIMFISTPFCEAVSAGLCSSHILPLCPLLLLFPCAQFSHNLIVLVKHLYYYIVITLFFSYNSFLPGTFIWICIDIWIHLQALCETFQLFTYFNHSMPVIQLNEKCGRWLLKKIKLLVQLHEIRYCQQLVVVSGLFQQSCWHTSVVLVFL